MVNDLKFWLWNCAYSITYSSGNLGKVVWIFGYSGGRVIACHKDVGLRTPKAVHVWHYLASINMLFAVRRCSTWEW